MKEKAIGYVVPHTHWDREWRYPIWENRLYLRDLMEELIDTLEKNPDYKSFLMDGQVIAILDYLEICPEKEKVLKKLISENRIQIGPWYTLPDLYPVSGESIVRNLLKGKIVAQELGGYLKIGYESFGWGQPSQLPQIYKGFDIDTVIVSKNVDKSRAPRCEFIWVGADGTKVLATRLGDDARANFFMNAYLKIMTGKEYKSEEYEYQYGKDGQIYHQGDKEHIQDYFLLEETGKIHKEYIEEAVKKAWHGMKDTLLPDHRIMMDGTDSTTSQPKLMELLQEINKQIEEIEFRSSSLEEYVSILKDKLNFDDVIEIHGEMRDGPTTSLSGNALMTRAYIKTLNKNVQNKLFGMAEPVSAMNMLLGEKYEEKFLDKAMDYLLLSHPHDSINGVTQDKTADDVVYRLSQAGEIADTVYNRGLQQIIKKIDFSKYEKEDLILVVFNQGAKARREIIEVYIDTPQDRNIWDFCMEDSKGNKRELQFAERKEVVSPVVHLHARPYPYYTDRHRIFFDTGEVSAGGYEVYRLIEMDTFIRKTKFWAKTRKTDGRELATGCDFMENDIIRVKVNSDGSITITDKRINETYGPLNYYESTGDVGDYWMYYPPYSNKTYTSKGIHTSIYLKENGNLSATIGVDMVMHLPKYAYRPDNYIRGKSERSEELQELPITTYYTLKKDSDQVEVKVIIDNKCMDHRMSVLMETGVKTDTACAQGHFTVDERPALPRKDEDGRYYNELTTQPLQNFLSLYDGNRGFAVITDCLGEYELRKDHASTVAFTLFRAVRNIICTEFRSEGYFPNQDGGQLLRKLQYHYAISPQREDFTKEDLARKAEEFNVPLKPIQTSVPSSGKGILPSSYSFYEVSGKVNVSCLKKGIEDNTIILRVYNSNKTREDVAVKLNGKIQKAELTDLKEEFVQELDINENTIKLVIPANKIYTIKFTLTHIGAL
ncbi:glycoside hydrolase family 38 C-terminal domain-containing protein [Lachnoclostridium sp.]|uniref:glycoside hydrolase family 38 N-terminal domain-containing protein n=1 Tax=Lachnoclostridium sp. TaxID=2028282 RepID=UPI00289F3498|nr:glycoside hydrolase family 38 C-terminal domain-containing protein [Lachnoclostridium sp.]